LLTEEEESSLLVLSSTPEIAAFEVENTSISEEPNYIYLLLAIFILFVFTVRKMSKPTKGFFEQDNER